MAEKLDKDKSEKLSDELAASTLPAAEAIACRLALFGACGELWADNNFIKKQFANSEEIGKQLLSKMNSMEKEGWHFGPMSVQDPGPKICIIPEKISLRSTSLQGVESAINSAIKRTTIISSNISNLVSVGAICNDVGRSVSYNPISQLALSLTGCFASTSSPARLTAEVVAHEIAHHDGIPKLFSLKEVDNFTRQEAITSAKRIIISEARAHLTQAAFADEANIKDSHAKMIKQQTSKGTLGEWIHAQYKHNSGLRELKLLSGADCNKLVNEHFEEFFGKDLIDPHTKKLTIKDINAGFGKEIGTIRLDSSLTAKMQNPAYSELESNKLLRQLDGLGKSLHNPILNRAAQCLSGLGLVWTVGDLGGAFSEGPRAGLGRVASMSTNWLGWELGGKLASIPARFMPRQAGTLALAGGLIGSMLSAEFIGLDLEQAIKGSSHNA